MVDSIYNNLITDIVVQMSNLVSMMSVLKLGQNSSISTKVSIFLTLIVSHCKTCIDWNLHTKSKLLLVLECIKG